MNQNKINFVIDLVNFLLFLGLAASGLVMKYGVECGGGRGFRGGRGVLSEPDTFLGLVRAEWSEIHFALATVLIITTLVHLLFHWRWVKCQWRGLWRKKELHDAECEARSQT